MPVYNAEQYLAQALDSILAQTVSDFEIVAVDDGSTDNSPQILKTYSVSRDCIRVVRQSNSGISAALNAGLAVSRGEFIARMDADDIMLPDRLARQMAFLRAEPAIGFCGCHMNLMGSEGHVFGVYKPKPTTLAELNTMIAARETFTFSHPTVMMRRDLVLAAGGYDARYEPCEDINLFTNLIASGHPGVILADVLLSYRMHAASISARRAYRQAEILHLVMRNLEARLAGRAIAGPEILSDYPAKLPLIERLSYRASLRSEAWRQVAVYDRAARKPWKARLRLGVAALLQPRLLPRRILRRIRGVGHVD